MFVSGISKLTELQTQNLLQIKKFNCPVHYLHELKSMLVLRNSCTHMYMFFLLQFFHALYWLMNPQP